MTDLALSWTNEPPKQPGWYWQRTSKGAAPTIRSVRFDNTNGCYVVRGCGGREYVTEMKQDVQWAGPIPEPTDE